MENRTLPYPSDEATGSGNNVISGADFPAQPHFVATPVIPYCTGEIDENSAGLGPDTPVSYWRCAR